MKFLIILFLVILVFKRAGANGLFRLFRNVFLLRFIGPIIMVCIMAAIFAGNIF